MKYEFRVTSTENKVVLIAEDSFEEEMLARVFNVDPAKIEMTPNAKEVTISSKRKEHK
jgi:hypothetical protein